jgi:hypothetical protein
MAAAGGGAVSIPAGPTAKEQRYDRQLRLWGAQGQAALENAHVLLINSGTGAVGIETLKNLVLPGMYSDLENSAVVLTDSWGKVAVVSRYLTKLLLHSQIWTVTSLYRRTIWASRELRLAVNYSLNSIRKSRGIMKRMWVSTARNRTKQLTTL